MKIFALVLTVLFFSISANAYDCAKEKQNILNDLMENVQCTQDVECGYFNFGYPWQPEICTPAIINVKKENHNVAELRLIAEYNNFCIYPDKAEKDKLDDFRDKQAAAKCSAPVRVYCYKGFCRSQSYAIYNDQ